MVNPDSQTDIAESPSEPGSPPGSPEFVIGRVCPSKRASTCVAGCWVRFGGIRVRLKIIHGVNGLFVVGPSATYMGRNGRRCYVHHVWLEPDLHTRLTAAVLAGYKARLAEDGRRVPGFRGTDEDLDDDLDDGFGKDLDDD